MRRRRPAAAAAPRGGEQSGRPRSSSSSTSTLPLPWQPRGRPVGIGRVGGADDGVLVGHLDGRVRADVAQLHSERAGAVGDVGAHVGGVRLGGERVGGRGARETVHRMRSWEPAGGSA